MRVELIYVAQDKRVAYLQLELAEGSTVEHAITQTHFYQLHPETVHCAIGLFGKVVPLNTVLRDGDRIEFYRPLCADPKDKRRAIARSKKR